MKNYKYIVTIYWSEEDKCYVATAPELPGCATHGNTPEQATRNMADAIDSWLEAAKEARHPIPEPTTTKKYSGKFVTRIDPDLHRKLAIKSTEKGKSLNRFVQELLSEAVA